MGRAVRHLVEEAGVRQILDLGTGIPTSPNVHEIAQAAAPGTRVVYVDNDPIVLAHARALLTSQGAGETAFIMADLRQPKSILDHPSLTETLDLTQPVAVVLVGVLMYFHSKADVERFFTGLELVDPGVTPMLAWRPTEPPADPHAAYYWAGVGRKP
jgi:O-methyltransferase involved in polyketide biosynthesis